MNKLPGIPSGIVLAMLATLAHAAPPPVAAPPAVAPAGRVELPPRPASAVAAASAPASAVVPMPAPPAAPTPPLVDACPAQLPVHQTIAQDIAGWTAVNEQASYPFARVALFPGPPGESARIVPTTEFNTAAGLHDAWDLPKRAAGYWLACSYGNTTATLARKLPDNVDFCQADYDGRFLTLVVKRWSCGDRRVLPPSVRAPARNAAKSAAHPASPKPFVKPPYRHGE
jgi:hypothetical protein